ncbi:preprotein translocase subunit YajC [Vallicoccus soli]|uniref:Preprotein translocase subunit YajC n=1 Tax=Vallicoccus soli TaxID=2339232 RepID=A0A3A3Z233_9ACTN|nr:preprotein translocase subunit YajC [Vallicoccus soli]RJK96794.1 preprotein translocase subunit YajC [Vallicoccus soli]
MDIASLLPFLLILVVGYLLLVRPARNRQREMAQLQEQLVPGVEVMTTAGLYATVVALDETSVTLETGPGTTSRWDRRAVARVVTPLDAAPDAPAYADDLDRPDGPHRSDGLDRPAGLGPGDPGPGDPGPGDLGRPGGATRADDPDDPRRPGPA